MPRPLSAATVEHAQSQPQPQHAPFAVDRRCRAHTGAGGGGRGQVAAWPGLVLAWLGLAVCKRSIMSRAVTFILNLIYIFLLPLIPLSLSSSLFPPLCYLAFVFGQAAATQWPLLLAVVVFVAAGDLSAASKACNSFCLLPFASCLLIELQCAVRAC